jgi:hypothetical protein
LTPVSSFNGWGVSAIDALDTAMLMGVDDLIASVSPHVAKLSFSSPPLQGPSASHFVSFFETTIRYLGGFLSAYAISGDPILLMRADDLGRALLPAFNTSSRLPASMVDVTS